jgi:hypothetical protein
MYNYNMTFKEARQRCAVNNCSLQRTDHGEYRVSPRGRMSAKEREDRTYYTDDLEDAALTSATLH